MAKKRQRKKSKRKTRSPYELPRIALLQKRQWRFIQKRHHLTDRELDIAALVCRGYSNDEAAKVLHIRQGTVKTHIRNIYRKIKVRNKIAMLLRFVEDARRLSPIVVRRCAS